jgi:hypothetical protein
MGKRAKLDDSIRDNRTDYRFYSDALLRQRIKAKATNVSAIDTISEPKRGWFVRWADKKYARSLAKQDVAWLKTLGETLMAKLADLAADAPKLIFIFILGYLLGERHGQNKRAD